MRTATAHDHRQFSLIVELLGDLGANQGLSMADQNFGQTQEDNRMLSGLDSGLFAVAGVIHANADDLVRIGNRRHQRTFRQREVSLGALAVLARPLQRLRFEQFLESPRA